MIGSPLAPVVYDAGALLAAERNDRSFLVGHRRLLDRGRRIIVPAAVLAQVWRGGARQAPLSRALRSCVVEPTTETITRRAGVLLSRSGTSDAIEAIVVATAQTHHALIMTSDPDDISRLWYATGIDTEPGLIVI